MLPTLYDLKQPTHFHLSSQGQNSHRFADVLAARKIPVEQPINLYIQEEGQAEQAIPPLATEFDWYISSDFKTLTINNQKVQFQGEQLFDFIEHTQMIIKDEGIINIDYLDILTILSPYLFVAKTQCYQGEDCAEQAIEELLAQIGQTRLSKAQGIIIYISAQNLDLDQLNTVLESIRNSEAALILGTSENNPQGFQLFALISSDEPTE